jgi:hypothetical protein
VYPWFLALLLGKLIGDESEVVQPPEFLQLIYPFNYSNILQA